jgi:hypothetical protein
MMFSRKILSAAICFALFAPLANLSASGFVRVTAGGFTTTVDLNGDGFDDPVVADAATGQLRFALQDSSGNLMWLPAVQTGLPSVDGLASGDFLTEDLEGVALSSTSGNRVVFAELSGTSSIRLETAFPEQMIGPTVLGGIEVGASGSYSDSGLMDLFLVSSKNYDDGYETPLSLGSVVNSAQERPVLPLDDFEPELTSPVSRPNRVELSDSRGAFLAFHLESDAQSFLYFVPSPVESLTPEVLLPHETAVKYTVGDFSTETGSLILTWGAAQPSLNRYFINDEIPASLTTKELEPVVMDDLVDEVIVLQSGPGGRILVTYQGGGEAEIYEIVDEFNLQLLEQLVFPKAGLLQGALSLGNGNFLTLEGDGTDSASDFAVYADDGGGYAVIQSGDLPDLTNTGTDGRATVFLFEEEPFLSDSPGLVARYEVGDWSVEAALKNGDLLVETRGFVDSESGLAEEGSETLPGYPESANYVLTNDTGEFDLSVFGLDRESEGGRTFDLDIEPASGTYGTSIKLAFETNLTKAAIFWRTASPSGQWNRYDASTPPILYRDAEINAYAESASGERTPIQTATYRFEIADPGQDSDGDGVPDFVELYYGLDPLTSGTDGDGDGATDLQEILAGTDPASATSTPAVLNAVPTSVTWNAELIPRAYDPGAFPEAVGREVAIGTGLWLHALSGAQEASGLTATNGSNISFVASEVPYDSQLPLKVASTQARFGLNGLGTSDQSGRELVALVKPPELSPLALDSFTYTGGTLAEEVADWRSQMSAYVGSLETVDASHPFEPQDTLIFALFEAVVGKALFDRGLVASVQVDLAPFRLYGADREAVTPPMLRSLKSAGPAGETAYRLDSLYAAISEAIETSEASEISALIDLNTVIYQASVEAAPDAGLPYPLDALRFFLANGELPEAYDEVTPDATTLGQAESGAEQILGNVPARPQSSFTLEVDNSLDTGGCTTLERVGFGTSVSLFDASGLPYRFSEGAGLTDGSRLSVQGYTDLDSGDCPGQAIEVISIVLDFMVTPSSADADGNLLDDDWERYFFGSPGVDPYDDASGNGYSNLQQMLEGTDPLNGGALDVPIMDLSPPGLETQTLTNGTIRVEWSWPSAYDDQIDFIIRKSSTLESFGNSALTPVYQGGGAWAVDIDPATYGDKQFFRAILRLR